MSRNSFDIDKILRDNIRAVKPYSSARHEFTGQADIFLDANENSFGSTVGENYHRYPDPLQQALKSKLAAVKNVDPETIFVGNGSDEPIDLLFRAVCRPGIDQAITMPPTYGMYAVSAAINDVGLIEVPLTPTFDIDVARVTDAFSERTKLTFICSPNNPTGTCFPPNQIAAIIDACPGLVVLDEAYIDFAPDKSFVPRLKLFSNLVILHTFSKAWGLANLRVGMAFAHPSIIAVLNKIKPPYNVNGQTQNIALQALEKASHKNHVVEQILIERDWLADALSGVGFVKHVFPSDANFLLVRVDDAAKRYRQLIEANIIVRDRSTVTLCENCLRITVGTSNENRRLIRVCKELEMKR